MSTKIVNKLNRKEREAVQAWLLCDNPQDKCPWSTYFQQGQCWDYKHLCISMFSPLCESYCPCDIYTKDVVTEVATRWIDKNFYPLTTYDQPVHKELETAGYYEHKATEYALLLTIEYWQHIPRNESSRPTDHLCDLFYKLEGICNNCPIALYSDEADPKTTICRRVRASRLYDHRVNWHDTDTLSCPQCLTLKEFAINYLTNVLNFWKVR